MSAFTKRARYLTFSGLATLGLAVVAQFGAAGTVSAVDVPTYPETLHQDPPIKNSEFEDSEDDCPGSPAQWGWHFILTGNDAEFVELTTTFQTAGVIVTTTFGPPSDKHAYVYTATDDTLLAATAVVTGGDPSKVRLVLSHTCDGGGTSTPSATPSVTPSESVSPSETVTPSETVSPSETVTPSETVSPSETVTPSETVSPSETVTPSETVSPSESVSPTETVSPTESVSPSESVAPTETVSPSESVAPTESESPVPSASVSGIRFTNTPSESVSPSVGGVKQTRGPSVRGTRLPNTGSPAPVALLLLLGFGLVGAGVVATVSGEAKPVTAGGRHRA